MSGAIRDLTHDLGEPDDVDCITRIVAVSLANILLEPARNFDIVEPLAGSRVELEQARTDDRAAEVIGNEPADDSGHENVGSDGVEALRIGRKIRRNHVARSDAILHDLGETDIGREQ